MNHTIISSSTESDVQCIKFKLYGLIILLWLFLQPGLGTVSLNKCSPVISVWWEGGAGHIRLSRMGGVGLRDEPGYDLLLTVITNLDAEKNGIYKIQCH